VGKEGFVKSLRKKSRKGGFQNPQITTKIKIDAQLQALLGVQPY
jgi:hypothetical protein